MIYDLFPTAIGRYKFDRDFTKDELNFFYNQMTRPNEGNRTSTNYFLLKEKTLHNIKLFLEESLKSYTSETIAHKDNCEFYISQSWSNYTSKDEYHHKHKHTNSIISGVLLVQTQLERDGIMFHKGEDNSNWRFPTKDWNRFNSLTWEYSAIVGDLYLFPSTLVHQVPMIEKEGCERISLSFNTFVRGEIGNADNCDSIILDKNQSYRG